SRCHHPFRLRSRRALRADSRAAGPRDRKPDGSCPLNRPLTDRRMPENTDGGRADLPAEPAHRFTHPLIRFLKIEAASGVLLLLSVIAALGVANSPWSSSYLQFWETPAGFRFGAVDLER